MNLTSDDRGIVVRCRSCGARNRLSYKTLSSETRCANCKTTLPKVDLPVEINSSAAFQAITADSTLPVLVDFWAEWCGRCKMVAPELEKAAAETAGETIIGKVNTEELPEVAARFQISSIPTLALLYNGREIARLSGARPARDIVAFVRQNGRK